MPSHERRAQATASVSLDIIPTTLLPDDRRPLLNRMLLESDRLLFLDRTLELAADRDTLIAIARDEELIPAALRDIEILETAKHLGRRVKRFEGARRLTWVEAAKYGLPVQPATADEFKELGIVEGVSAAGAGELFLKRFPDLPRTLFATEPAELHSIALKNLTVNRTVWDCLVANLGFWAALTWIGSSVIFVSLLTLGWQVALAVAIAYSGFATGYVILQCLVNQEFRLF